ncbi:hypothetical protein [Mycobacterium sp. NPDC006124]|uniref:hypothetical protein n=1 Tax=Mycobacterium sp. NPDC006124 TaxID=3156729 RepID=UPI0033B4CFAE
MSTTQPHSASRSTPPSSRSGAVAVVALVLALVAVGLSTWTALRHNPTGAAEPTYTAAQQNDAKTAICSATEVVRKGVSLNTNLQGPGGEGDVTGALAVAANARLSLSDGGQYLLTRLEPATPTELADAVKQFANTLLDIGAAATAGVSNGDPAQAARLRTADTQNTAVTERCK